MTIAERAAALDALYAEIPEVECKGFCADSCGPFPPYPAELQRLLYEVGSAPSVEHWTCPLLVNGRCRAHAIRPLLCRLWGVVDGMPCEWGCKPARRYTNAEAHALAARVEAVA